MVHTFDILLFLISLRSSQRGKSSRPCQCS